MAEQGSWTQRPSQHRKGTVFGSRELGFCLLNMVVGMPGPVPSTLVDASRACFLLHTLFLGSPHPPAQQVSLSTFQTRASQ
jgi:hypothetical protein